VIVLDEINAGDEVTLQDGNRNVVVGEARRADDGTFLFIEVFGHQVPFVRLAQRRRPPHWDFWAEVHGVRVVGHLPAMF
jgi:hypothetical protein